MYWSKIDQPRTEPNPTDKEIHIYEQGQFENHYIGLWQNDKKEGQGTLLTRIPIDQIFHYLIKEEGIFKLDKLINKPKT